MSSTLSPERRKAMDVALGIAGTLMILLALDRLFTNEGVAG